MSLENFIHFLDRSPTVYHAAKEIEGHLAEYDFTPLDEGERWKLEAGKGYFVVRDNTLVAAFRIPKKYPMSATILASHIDSPALKVKPRPEIFSHGMGQIGTEVYGGPLLHTWLDRDLALAGRIVVQGKKGACISHVVLLDEYPVVIPSLAIHLNREVNEKGLIVHRQDHLKAIFTLRSKEKRLEDWLKKHHPFEKLLSFDLFLVPTEKAALIGFENEMVASYRLDNLTSAFACLAALTNTSARSDTIQMALFWDHEEIGSKTYARADTLFANQVLERICLSYKMDREDYYRMKSRSLCISCDVGHAWHPNFPDKYDPQNAAMMGKGPTLKFSSKYATSGSTAAPIVKLAEKRKIPLQTFASRSDISSGSTVGSIMAANLGIPTVDLGIACWAMHSTRETIAASDQLALCQLLQCALEEPLVHPEEA
jgi:aspartyl aminopeptidase